MQTKEISSVKTTSGTIPVSSLLFFLLIAIPINAGYLFSGLPWTSLLETISIVIIVPLLFILNQRFFKKKDIGIIVFCILGLLLFQAFTTSKTGLAVKVYKTYDDYVENQYVKTYNTLWNNQYSTLQKESFKDKEHFPIEWANEIRNDEKRDNLTVILEIHGKFILKEGESIKFNTKGSELFTINDTEVIRKKFKVVTIHRVYRFTGSEWLLQPLIVKANGRYLDPFRTYRVWDPITGSNRFIFDIVLGIISSLSVIGLIVYWIINTLFILWKKTSRNIHIFILGLIISCISILLKRFVRFPLDNNGYLFLALSFCISICVYCFYTRKGYRLKSIVIAVFLFFLPVIIFYSDMWIATIGKMSFFSTKDDWTTYQNFAREIVLTPDILHKQVGPFRYQPLYRYIVALFHILFGKSAFAQRFFDVWIILLTSIVLMKWVKKMYQYTIGKKRETGILISFLYLFIIFSGSFAYRIGQGLQEYAAMFFLVLTAWLIYNGGFKTSKSIIIAGLVGILAYWLRQDHLPSIGLLFVFAYGGSAKPLKIMVKEWRKIFLYSGIILIGVGIVIVRNYFVGGSFALVESENVQLLRNTNFRQVLISLNRIIIGGDHIIPFYLHSLIMVSGIVISFIAVFTRKGLFSNLNFSYGIIIGAIISPYLLVRANAYQPRFSIHLLPFTVIVVFIFLINFYRKIRETKNV